MRVLSSLLASAAALAALSFAQAASAATVTLAPVGFSDDFQTELTDNLGVREGAYLQQRVERAVTRALERAGAQLGPSGDITVETSIIDADPNRPTMEQTSARPGLDPIRSISIGGAELHAVIRDRSGQTLAEVTHRYYSPSLSYVFYPASQWADAQRAILGFANKVGAAYRDSQAG